MLKILRKKGVAKKVSWFIAIIIIISFGFFGTAYLLNSQKAPRYAGKIFNRSVALSDFERAYRHAEMFMRIRFGEKYNDVRSYLNLDN